MSFCGNISLTSFVSIHSKPRGVLVRHTAFLLAGILALSSPNSGADKLDINDLPNHPFVTELPAATHLRLYLRSGDIQIRARDDNKLSVRYDGGSNGNFKDLGVRLERSADSTSLELHGGPNHDMHVTIEVPRSTSLFVRMSAGNLELANIAGDKDIRLRAGELIISIGDPKDYSQIRASVLTGDLEAASLGESHGGLFRSFTKDGPGKYKLTAHVTAGDLTLR
jgi:hypothetical protein